MALDPALYIMSLTEAASDPSALGLREGSLAQPGEEGVHLNEDEALPPQCCALAEHGQGCCLHINTPPHSAL